jgi:predicted O-methyltransferase YrrM
LNLLCVPAVAAAIAFGLLWWHYRRRLYVELGRDDGGAIPVVELDEFDDAFALGDLGTTPAAAVHFIGSSRGVAGGTSDREAWILAVLARRCRTMFEFGTATGKTTYLLASNSPADARVHTLTLAPDALASYSRDSGDSGVATRRAHQESRFTSFLYTGTAAEPKVTQLFGDSKALDTTPYRGACDLIFVDGSHAWSYVLSDTAKAFEMLAPGGIIIWHDYRPLRRSARDVCRALDVLARQRPLVRLRGTSMVAYRAPA